MKYIRITRINNKLRELIRITRILKLEMRGEKRRKGEEEKRRRGGADERKRKGD